MLFKPLRFWLASKIIGGQIIEERDIEEEKTKWIEEHLKAGGSLQLTYQVHTVQ